MRVVMVPQISGVGGGTQILVEQNQNCIFCVALWRQQTVRGTAWY